VGVVSTEKLLLETLLPIKISEERMLQSLIDRHTQTRRSSRRTGTLKASKKVAPIEHTTARCARNQNFISGSRRTNGLPPFEGLIIS
jgi:hypothetical protein